MSAPRPAPESQPVAETTHGYVRGIANNGVAVFRGIRYGANTGGAHRFLAPQAPPKWSGVRDAVEWGPSAPQADLAAYASPFYAWYSTLETLSEDCLSLNVFTPALDGGKRPVMVWLHGGGWRSFASTAPGTDGTQLARAQDVVVITVNHRLNLFGFLALGESDERFADSGNAGLLDLVLALRWVRDNAAAFGGDPNNVTLFGQSGGASKTAALLAMPAARGLFHKAIIQSTSGGMRIADQQEAERMASELAGVLGMSRLHGGDLQQLPMEVLLSALEKAPGPFRPVIDKRNFDCHPYYPAGPAISADVPVMAGTTDTETTWYYAAHPESFCVEFTQVKKRLIRFLKLDAAAVDTLIDTYRAACAHATATDVLTAITTDYLFKRNTLKIASLQSASAKAPVYSYVFARETPVGNGRFRSPHASEIPFVFGTTAAAQGQCGTGADIPRMTEIMMATWAAFARHGNPNNPTVPLWKPYEETKRFTMVLNVESRLEYDPGGAARAALDGLPYYEYSNDRASFLKD